LRLEVYDWLVVSSVRAVHALASARGPNAWPHTLRGAAVGAHTAQALREHGLERVVTGREGGADALLERLLAIESWPGRHVLAPRAADGRRVVERGLVAAGARVEEVLAYRTAAIPAERLRERWRAARPDAAVIASPSAARALVGAIGAPALCALRGVVAIGPTTAAALRELRVPSRVANAATFEAAAETLHESLARSGGIS
jgi:uroporphyrinogen-III synthase